MNSWYSEGTLERLGASANFVELAWMSKEWRQSSKLWKPESFDVYKNTVVLMIAILGHLELDMEVSDISIDTTESNNWRGISKEQK